MSNHYEYKVIVLREGLIGGKMSGGKLEGVLVTFERLAADGRPAGVSRGDS